MMMWSVLLVTIAVVLFSVSQGSKLVDEQLDVYERILREAFGKDKLDADGLVKLMQLIEGHPKYNHAAAEHIMRQLGSFEIDFKYLHELVNYIYGDMISDDPFQPQELKLAYTNDPSSMKIMWVTMSGLDKPFVQYMPAIASDWDKQAKVKYATNYTYTVPQKWWPTFTGLIYEVDMTGLTAESRYKYRVGGYDTVNQTMRYSDEYTFQAAPVPVDPNRPTRVFTAADHGTFEIFGFETSFKMHKVMDELKPDFVFVAGDLSYAGLDTACEPLDISKDDEFEHIWDLLGIQNQPVAARVPWMVGVGNHESFYNFTAFTNRFKMPQSPSLGSNLNFWYTFTYGNIQWVSISSEHDLSEGSPQMTFLRNALTSAQSKRATIPWVILTIHKPLYCSVEGSPSFASRLESILLEFDVDMTITGHMHAYERIHPVNQGAVTVYPVSQPMHDRLVATYGKEGVEKVCAKCGLGESDVYYTQGKGPVHVMQGHAGGMQVERWTQPPPAWSAFRMADGFIPRNDSEDGVQKWFREHNLGKVDFSDNTSIQETQVAGLPLMTAADFAFNPGYNYSHTYGFGVVTAINRTHLHYVAIPNVEGLRNHDEFWIVKDH